MEPSKNIVANCEFCGRELTESEAVGVAIPCGIEDYEMENACKKCALKYQNAPDLKTDS
jgi:hypothetical protein